MPLQEGTWWDRPNHSVHCRHEQQRAHPPQSPEAGRRPICQLCYVELGLASLVCKCLVQGVKTSLQFILNLDAQGGDGHLSASNPATTRCHRLLTGTQINENLKWFLFTWRTLNNLVPPPQHACGRPINKPGSRPTSRALKWQTPAVWSNRAPHMAQILPICLNNNQTVWLRGKSSAPVAHYSLHGQLTIKMTSQKRVGECFRC